MTAIIEELSELCNVESATVNPGGVNAMGRLLGLKLACLGFEMERVDLSAHNVGDFFTYRRYVSGDLPTVVVLVHLDTVGQDNPEVVTDGRYAYGTGCLDMKGGLVVMLEAMRELHLNGFNVVVLASSDEEAGSLHSREHIEVALSSCDPSSTLILCMEFNSCGELIVEQPGSHRWFAEWSSLPFEDFDAVANGLRSLCLDGKKCNPAILHYADDSFAGIMPAARMKLTFASDGGHAGTREANDERDTHLMASQVIKSLRQVIKPGRMAVRHFTGGEYANKIANRTVVILDVFGDALSVLGWLNREGVDVEVLPTGNHRFGHGASMAGDVRYISQEKQEALFAEMGSILGSAWTNRQDRPRRPAFERNERTVEFLRELGLERMASDNPTASDANLVSGEFMCINGLGPTGDGAHSPNERALLSSFTERINLFITLVNEFIERK